MITPVQVAVITGYGLNGYFVYLKDNESPVKVPSDFFLKGTPSNGDIYVEYDDGRIIWLNREQYLRCHEPIDEEGPESVPAEIDEGDKTDTEEGDSFRLESVACR